MFVHNPTPIHGSWTDQTLKCTNTMKRILIVLLFLASCNAPVTQNQPIISVPNPNKLIPTPTVEDKVTVPELPKVVYKEKPAKLPMEGELKRLFSDCIIEFKFHDVSRMPLIPGDYIHGGKYPDKSLIAILAIWSDTTHRRCNIENKSKELTRIVYEKDNLISLDFMVFYTYRDKYGYDKLSMHDSGKSFKKEVANKVNWKQSDKIDFIGINYSGRRLYYSHLYARIHKDMAKLVFERWNEKQKEGT